jgi:signal transduction histidine kinase
MRLYMVLIFTAVVMAFTTGYIALFIQGGYIATSSDVVEINTLKQEFQKEIDPVFIINFNSLYFSEDQFKLLDPSVRVRQGRVLPDENRFATSDGCDQPFSQFLNKENFEKVWVWEEFRCNRRNDLPRSFFIEAPFMHPSGMSFASLAFELGRNNYDKRPWVMAHLPFFHVSELAKIRRQFGPLSGIFEILQSVGDESLTNLMRGSGTILTKDYLFARLNYPKIFNILEYRIYTRKDLENFLKDSPYVLNNFQSGRSCFYRDGSLCWDYNVRHIFQLANTSTIALFIGMILIILGVVRLLLVKIKQHRLEDEKRRLALRILTHEFRTPITSLTLLLEKMGSKYESFDGEMEEVYLRLSTEVHRLRRLTETSRNYLKAEQKEKLLDLNYETLDSINDFVYQVVEPFEEKYGEDIKFIPLEEDCAIELDTYWMGICMKNLLENAFLHGEAPVVVKLMKFKNKVRFEVVDQGKCEFESLGIMTQEFMKGNKSSGTGLGMNIVKKVCHEMGVELKLHLSPTTFSLTLPISGSKKVRKV